MGTRSDPSISLVATLPVGLRIHGDRRRLLMDDVHCSSTRPALRAGGSLGFHAYLRLAHNDLHQWSLDRRRRRRKKPDTIPVLQHLTNAHPANIISPFFYRKISA